MSRRRRSRRGFTLLEVLVSAVLTGLFVTIAVQWVGALGRAGVIGGFQRSAERDAAWVQRRFEIDAANAVSCRPGQPSSIVEVGPDRLAFTLDDDEDGLPDRVTWTVANTSVTRQVQRAVTPCEYEATGDITLVSDLVDSTTGSGFRPVQSGSTTGVFAGIQDCSVRANCPWDGVTFTGVFRFDRDDAPPARFELVIPWR